jgi:hypothetical protein
MLSRWFTSGRRRGPRGSRAALLPLLVTVAFGAMTGTALATKAPQVDIVSQGMPPEVVPPNTHYFMTIQGAVNATHKGDWVLIEPGTYDEEVKVTKLHGGIHIRGMNRNTVILDGQHKVGNGIFIEKANNVWVENLTARNYDQGEGCTDPGGCGNSIWWNGGSDSKKQSIHGWFGSYLTAYQTDLLGGYGIFTQNEKEGSWENIYASGFNDSGIYIGACWECKALVNKATIEYNAVGYSGSNSGGNLVIENSTFRQNSAGIVPNGETPGDGPPPQNGMCNPKKPGKPYHLFTSTNIEHCTIFRDNLVTENNNLEIPANHSTEKAPWGVGIELPGDMADLVENNTITNNVNNGVLGFEYPNPFPPTPQTILFQLTGNKIANNTFINNGTSGGEYASDITLQGGLYPHGKFTSDNNCVSGNTLSGATFPANIEVMWGCQNNTTPPPENGLAAIGYVVVLSEESALKRIYKVPSAPGPQETMPEPCTNVPATTLCP